MTNLKELQEVMVLLGVNIRIGPNLKYCQVYDQSDLPGTSMNIAKDEVEVVDTDETCEVFGNNDGDSPTMLTAIRPVSKSRAGRYNSPRFNYRTGAMLGVEATRIPATSSKSRSSLGASPNLTSEPLTHPTTVAPKTPRGGKSLIPPGFNCGFTNEAKTKPRLTAPDGVTVFGTYKAARQWANEHPNYQLIDTEQLAAASLASPSRGDRRSPDVSNSQPGQPEPAENTPEVADEEAASKPPNSHIYFSDSEDISPGEKHPTQVESVVENVPANNQPVVQSSDSSESDSSDDTVTAPKSDAKVVSSSDIDPEGLSSFDWLMANSPLFRSIASQSDKKVKPVGVDKKSKKNKKSLGFL